MKFYTNAIHLRCWCRVMPCLWLAAPALSIHFMTSQSVLNVTPTLCCKYKWVIWWKCPKCPHLNRNKPLSVLLAVNLPWERVYMRSKHSYYVTDWSWIRVHHERCHVYCGCMCVLGFYLMFLLSFHYFFGVLNLEPFCVSFCQYIPRHGLYKDGRGVTGIIMDNLIWLRWKAQV